MLKEDDKFESLRMDILEQNEYIDPVIKIENTDDLDDENTCGMQAEEMLVKPIYKKIPNKNICYKCRKNKSNYLNRAEYICRECFMKIVNHKFRSNLRAHCHIRHEDYVLVCISGGNNSMAMLHWFFITFNDNTSNRKLFFKLRVIYVDDALLMLMNPNINIDYVNEIRTQRREFISSLCKKYGFEVEIINLEDSMDLPFISSNNCQLNSESISSEIKNTSNDLQGTNKHSAQELIEKYLNLYKYISKVGSFNEDFKRIMIRNVIFNYAIKNGFTKLVYGNSAQALVGNIFSSIVKGRGFTVKEDKGYIDDHFLNGKITILRPMKDFLAKEVLLFNYIYNVEVIYSPYFEFSLKESKLNKSHTPFNGSTTLLIDRFFEKLQEKMSSTVTAVMGTAEKLKVKNNSRSLGTCSFCLSYVDEIYNDLEIGSIDSISNDKIFGNKSFCFGCKRMLQSAISENEEILENLPTFYIN